jgi:hypothetical protein
VLRASCHSIGGAGCPLTPFMPFILNNKEGGDVGKKVVNEGDEKGDLEKFKVEALQTG